MLIFFSSCHLSCCILLHKQKDRNKRSFLGRFSYLAQRYPFGVLAFGKTFSYANLHNNFKCSLTNV
jgi:hypothetical protein